MARNADGRLREQIGIHGIEEVFAAALSPFIKRVRFGGVTVVTPSGGRIIHHASAPGRKPASSFIAGGPCVASFWVAMSHSPKPI